MGTWESKMSPPPYFGLSWWGFPGPAGDGDGEAVVARCLWDAWCLWHVRLCCGCVSQKAFLRVSPVLARWE